MTRRLITAVDAHTAGQPYRLVIGGLPYIPGNTMLEKEKFAKQNLDHIRTALTWEPRACGAALTLTPPVTDGAAFGLILPWREGYMHMCGSGFMSVATIVLEIGIVEPREPVTEFTIDTPIGLVKAIVNVENGKAKSVTLRNVPSFFYESAVIKVPGLGEVPVDIAYGGNFFVVVEAKDLGIKAGAQAEDFLRVHELTDQVRECTSQQVHIQHPEEDFRRDVDYSLVSDSPTNPIATVRNLLVMAGRRIAREPCGTGTCARMAIEYAKGRLKLGESYVTESIIGSHYYGKLIEETSVGSLKAVIPEVTGRAFITGMHTFVIDEDDPFKYGFMV